MILTKIKRGLMANTIAARAQQIAPFYVMAILDRARQLEMLGRDIIHMEIGEPDFPTPHKIVAFGMEKLVSGDIKYTPAAGLPELREKIASFYHTRYGVKVGKERIFVTPGASGAFLLAFGVSLNPGDGVLMADPCYPCNANFLRLYDALPEWLPTHPDSRYQPDAAMIRQHWHPGTRGVLIASPSNPTGTLITPEELKACIITTESSGGIFYSDEIYHGLVYGDQATTALSYSDSAFVINSFSKYFGMTGWRIGWLVVPERFVQATERLAQNLFISTPTLSQHAALAAFDQDTIDELEARKAEFAIRRDFLFDALTSLGFRIPIKPEGAFYIYADCSKFTVDSYQFALNFLEQEGVAVTPGLDFGQLNARKHLRFAYTTSTERMGVAMQRLKRFLGKL